MTPSHQQIVARYADAYQKLYNRAPKQLQVIDNDWVIVNGAQMRVDELQFLAEQLTQEYQQERSKKKSVVQRLVQWFKGY